MVVRDVVTVMPLTDTRQRLKRISVTSTCTSHETRQPLHGSFFAIDERLLFDRRLDEMPFVNQVERQFPNSHANGSEAQLITEIGETKDDLMLPTFVKIGEPAEKDKKHTAEALTAVNNGKDSTEVDRSAVYACRQLAKPMVKSGLSKTRLLPLPYAIGETIWSLCS